MELEASIISPTRELTGQLFDVLKSVGKYHSFSAGLLIGGRKDVGMEKEHVNELNILVCTPGRLLQHMDETPNFDCSQLQSIIVRNHSPPAKFSGELSWRPIFPTPTIPEGAPGGDLQSPPTFVKAPASKEDPRAIHAPFSGRRLHLTRWRVRGREEFSGDAHPPPTSLDADQPPYIPGSPIRALHVPLLGIFVSVGPPNSLSGEAPATFSPPQSLHVPWEVFFYLSGGTTLRSEAVSLFRWCHAAI
ncbi:DEAD-box ATP-dependent RNA helicase 32 [Vitis vinifera]|uniref:ATP-dependent RNA helicase n=1 Tax=Vitis vinifera TaxID=29760 RepID=A0A438IS43_VITVI|nr:DEAD-box ATP-dependent RNA helicase 32 [Vitis vinifera]